MKKRTDAQRDSKAASRMGGKLNSGSIFGPITVESSDVYPLLLRAIRYGRRQERARIEGRAKAIVNAVASRMAAKIGSYEQSRILSTSVYALGLQQGTYDCAYAISRVLDGDWAEQRVLEWLNCGNAAADDASVTSAPDHASSS